MIYTVTLNPALDYIVQVDPFILGKTNRTNTESIRVGGKGINVSVVLHNLGCETNVLGFVAGFTGKEVIHYLERNHIAQNMIEVKEGLTRINVKIKANEETEVNGLGPLVTANDLKKLMDIIKQMKPKDTLVLSGSVAIGIQDTIYEDIMKLLDAKGVRIVVDTTGSLLKNVLQYHPFLIKPNIDELGQFFDVEITSREDIIVYAKKLQAMGVTNVMVSLGKDGALLLDEHQNIYTSEAPKGKLIDSVGAGDSMVAGFLYGYEKKGSYKEAFAYGVSAGSASAFSKGLANKEEIEQLRMTVLKTVKEE